MNLQNKIANLVLYCQHCHPLSGCILSNLKGKEKDEIFALLKDMGELNLERIISFHQCCPYRDRLMV
jgi:hypothetical protein